MGIEEDIARLQLLQDPMAATLQLPIGTGLLEALGLPHQYVTRPYVVDPMKKGFEYLLPGITQPQEVPMTAQLPEAPWQSPSIFPEYLGQMTEMAPGAGTVAAEAAGMLADIPVYNAVTKALGLGARGIEAVAGMGKPEWGRFLAEEAGVMRPYLKPLGEPKLPWGETQSQQMAYKQIEGMPGLAKEKKALFKGVSEPNPGINELTAAYNTNLMTDIGQIETYFKNYLNRDASGKSLFDLSWERQIEKRRDLMKQPEYKVEKQSVSTGRSNIKTEGEINPFDCSRGCVGFCPECYAAFGKSNPRSAAFPKEVEWVGFATKAKEGNIYRIGENGEPGFNPITWKKTEPEFKALMKSGQPFSPDDLYKLTEPHYDWSYFNNQMTKTGLADPKMHDKTYVITKLQGLKNFDPNIIRNLQASLDTLNPDHFFRTLKNIEAIKNIDPNYNIMMRIRSIATSNDEINALQKIAVDFANKNNIPVLETRLRFKQGEGAALAEVLPEYIWTGVQYVHQSYYPSIFPKTPQHPAIEGNIKVSSWQAHTPQGPIDTGVYMTTTTDQKGPKALWQVWQPDGTMVGEYPADRAKEVGQGLANMYSKGTAPTKQTVWEINRAESPLSQFELDPKLHYQCNALNVSGPACKECGACKAFAELEKARAK